MQNRSFALDLAQLGEELEALEGEKQKVDSQQRISRSYYEVRTKGAALVKKLGAGNFPGLDEEEEKTRIRLYSMAHFYEMLYQPPKGPSRNRG